MKNTIKYISKMVLGLGLVAVGFQVQAVTLPVSTVPNFTPITMSGSVTTGIQTSTNGTNYVFSNKTGTFNNAFILSEFYASDDAAGLRSYPAIAKAAGDYLAILIQRPLTNYTPAVWATLPSGVKIVVTNAVYYYQDTDPWTGNTIYNGDIVILNAKGNLKADLTQAGLASNWWNEEYSVWNYTSYGKFSYSPETWNFLDHSSLNFYFYFGEDNDYIRLQTWGGGSVTSTKGVANVGGMTFTGTVRAYIANPQGQVATPAGVYCDQTWIGPASYSSSSWIKWWGD